MHLLELVLSFYSKLHISQKKNISCQSLDSSLPPLNTSLYSNFLQNDIGKTSTVPWNKSATEMEKY